MAPKSAIAPTENEWHAQWAMYSDSERFLFDEWIAPATLEDFRDKIVLECGCGGGQHTDTVAQVAKNVVAVDLNTVDLARQRNAKNDNVEFVESDLTTMDLGRTFDVVFCIGVIHHTGDPDATFDRLYQHCNPGGLVIVWTYSAEGNAMVKYGVEPVRKAILRFLPRRLLHYISWLITALLYPIVYSIYKIPILSFLPYYEYFQNFRRLSFQRNLLNVFDKLNAPSTKFTTATKCREWMSDERFEPATVSINRYKGVSYSLVGMKRR